MQRPLISHFNIRPFVESFRPKKKLAHLHPHHNETGPVVGALEVGPLWRKAKWNGNQMTPQFKTTLRAHRHNHLSLSDTLTKTPFKYLT